MSRHANPYLKLSKELLIIQRNAEKLSNRLKVLASTVTTETQKTKTTTKKR